MSNGSKAGLFGGIAVIIVVVAIIVASMGGTTHGKSSFTKPFSDPAITNAVTHVSPALLAKAGAGTALLAPVPSTPPSTTGMLKLSGKPLTSNGKPLLVYLGAEYCPYCAATRWPMAIALSRFGTFSGLKLTSSSWIDVYNRTPTLTFAGATYTSKYLTLQATEQLSNECAPKSVISNPNFASAPPSAYETKLMCNNGNYLPLETAPKQTIQLATQLDSATNFGPNGAGGIPFIDFGGRYVEDGSIYSPALLHGLSWAQVVNSFKVPTQGLGQSILTAANRYTAMICEMTGNKGPAGVCTSAVVKQAEKALG
jgi:thiol-disulfide isomerase/thioredoxin